MPCRQAREVDAELEPAQPVLAGVAYRRWPGLRYRARQRHAGGQRLVIEPQSCAIAAQSGWGERGEKTPQVCPIGPEESAAYMQQPPV